MKYWMTFFGCLGFLGFLGPNAGLADGRFWINNQFHLPCAATENPPEDSVCHGYLQGYAAGYGTALLSAINLSRTIPADEEFILDILKTTDSFCVPKGVDLDQLREGIFTGLDDTKVEGGFTTMLVLLAFTEAFPCKE